MATLRRTIILTCLLVLCSAPAFAATYYVRAGAGGAGANWTTALSDLPASFSAGDTYYVAEGSYSGRTINAANVTIRRCVDTARATQACQGVSGWNNTYGDGQATIGTPNIQANGFTLDGVVRNASNWADAASYGFRSTTIGYTSTFNNPGNLSPDDVTIRYAAGGGTSGAYTEDEVLYIGGFQNACNNWTVEYNLLQYHQHYTLVQALTTTNSAFRFNRFQTSTGKEAIRGQLQFNDNIIAFNQFYDACGYGGAAGEGCTAEMAAWGENTNWSGNQIYGNWFWRSRDENSGATILMGGANCYPQGGSCLWGGPAASNTLVYNNTFVGFSGGNMVGLILLPSGAGTGNVARNNLWYNTPQTSVSNFDTTSNNVVAGSNPFVNYAGADLHLTSAGAGALAAGTSLASPYNVDMDGTTRGSDGKWDVGAYEYPPGGGSAPPTGTITLSVRSLVWWIILPVAALLGLLGVIPALAGWMIRSVFDGRCDRAGGVGDVGSGEDGAPVRPLAPGALQAVAADDSPASGGESVDTPVAVAHKSPKLAASAGRAVVR